MLPALPSWRVTRHEEHLLTAETVSGMSELLT